MSEAKQLFMDVSLSVQKQSVDAVEALNTFRGPQGPQGYPGGIDNLMVNGKKPALVDGLNTIDLTAADVGALPAGGTAVNATQLNGKDAKYYTKPINLLHNSDFTSFVAQAGITGTHGAVSYAGDRWILFGSNVTGVANADGDGYTDIILQGGGRIDQVVAGIEKYYGQPMTAALWLSDESVIVGSAIINSPTADYETPISVSAGNGINIYLQARAGTARRYAFIISSDSSPVTIRAAALLPGTYTAETVPPYVPKGYAAELAECQRYFYNFPSGSGFYGYAASGGEAYLRFDLPQIMRIANPSVEFAGSFLTYSGSYYSANTINEVRGYGKQIRITVALNEAGTSRSVGGYINNNLLVSADL